MNAIIRYEGGLVLVIKIQDDETGERARPNELSTPPSVHRAAMVAAHKVLSEAYAVGATDEAPQAAQVVRTNSPTYLPEAMIMLRFITPEARGRAKARFEGVCARVIGG